MEKIPYSKQSINSTDIDAVTDAIQQDFITQGPTITHFESAFAAYVGSRYAVAVSSGTSALVIAHRAAGIQAGDRVLTTANTFVATANSIELAGGIAQLVDIDPKTYNISVTELEKALLAPKRIKGISPVHFAGVPANMEAIAALADKHKLYVIEDACHALGSTWADSEGGLHRVGDCSHSDMSIFSFHPVKQITTGEGGMITTNDPELHAKLLAFRSHGISQPIDKRKKEEQPWTYEMHDLSANHRITDIQCALGLSQLKQADNWMKRRSELVERYNLAFRDEDNLDSQICPKSATPSYHLYVVQAEGRDELYHHLHGLNIKVQVHYIPVHFHPYYQRKGYQQGDFPDCETYYDHALSLPLYPTLTNKQQDFVIEKIREFYHGR